MEAAAVGKLSALSRLRPPPVWIRLLGSSPLPVQGQVAASLLARLGESICGV